MKSKSIFNKAAENLSTKVGSNMEVSIINERLIRLSVPQSNTGCPRFFPTNSCKSRLIAKGVGLNTDDFFDENHPVLRLCSIAIFSHPLKIKLMAENKFTCSITEEQAQDAANCLSCITKEQWEVKPCSGSVIIQLKKVLDNTQQAYDDIMKYLKESPLEPWINNGSIVMSMIPQPSNMEQISLFISEPLEIALLAANFANIKKGKIDEQRCAAEMVRMQSFLSQDVSFKGLQQNITDDEQVIIFRTS